MSLPRKSPLVHTRSAQNPAPIWQSEAVRAGAFIFTSAKLATNWVSAIAPEAQADQQFPHFGCPSERQTEYILRSLAQTLEQAGSTLERVIKAHVFLLDSAQFPGFDRVWKRYFPNPPTRTTVGADGLLIPGALLEISLIAVASDSGITPQPAKSDAPRPLTKKSRPFVPATLSSPPANSLTTRSPACRPKQPARGTRWTWPNRPPTP